MNTNNIKIVFAGSCQLGSSAINYFFNEKVLKDNFITKIHNIPLYLYSKKIGKMYRGELNYDIFNDYDIIIIENNNYFGSASSEKIINYCIKNNKKIIKTCMLKFPIYPINWSGFGENKTDYINIKNIKKVDYKVKFNKCINSFKKNILKTDLDMNIVDFIEINFNKILLFTHSLHPTNILLYNLYKSIFNNLNIDINKYTFPPQKDILYCPSMINPFTTKMIQDLNIQFNITPNNRFYIQRYNYYKNIVFSKKNDI